MPKARIAIALAVLLAAMLSVASPSSGSQSRTDKAQTVAHQQAAVMHQRLELRKGISFYRQSTWRWQDTAGLPRTPASFAERRAKGRAYLRWIARLWRGRSHRAHQYLQAHPWLRLIRTTYDYRQCIITGESRSSGLYHAQNPHSTASGAYQFLDGTWQSEVQDFERYYHRNITSASRAIDAPPRVQDAIAAYAIKADHGQPWLECRGTSLTLD